jgi:N,N'-diacetyllegionaminate synthase
MEPYIFGETAFHHEGSVLYLKKLIDVAADSGLQGVKFQILMGAENLLSKAHPQYEVLSKYVLTTQDWGVAFEYAKLRQLDVIVMPLDVEAFSLITRYRTLIHGLELHSVSFYDQVLLDAMQDSGLPIMLGIGGRTYSEIKEKVAFLGNQLTVLIAGFQAFPSKIRDIKIERIQYYKETFPGIQLGYADHSSFSDPMAIKSCEYALLLGATYFEKHITVDEGVQRVDFESALGLEKMIALRQSLEFIAGEVIPVISTDKIINIEPVEQAYRSRQRIAIAKTNIVLGEKLDDSNVIFRMTGSDEGFSALAEILGKSASMNIHQYAIISAQNIIDT